MKIRKIKVKRSNCHIETIRLIKNNKKLSHKPPTEEIIELNKLKRKSMVLYWKTNDKSHLKDIEKYSKNLKQLRDVEFIF